MPKFSAPRLRRLLADLRLRCFASGLLIGAVAHALGEHGDTGSPAPIMAVVVVLAGASSVLCFTLEAAARRDAAVRRRLGHQVLLYVGIGILLAMQAPVPGG